MKFYCGDNDLLLNVQCKKLIIRTNNSHMVLRCDNLKIESGNSETIKIIFLVKMMPIGLIEYEKIEYIILEITENELTILIEH